MRVHSVKGKILDRIGNDIPRLLLLKGLDIVQFTGVGFTRDCNRGDGSTCSWVCKHKLASSIANGHQAAASRSSHHQNASSHLSLCVIPDALYDTALFIWVKSMHAKRQLLTRLQTGNNVLA